MKAVKLPSGSWNVRVYLGEVDGKRKWKSVTAPTKQEALSKAVMYEVARPADLTLKEACQRFLDIRGGELSPATYRVYDSTFRLYIAADMIGGVKLDKITTPLLQAWVGRLPNMARKTKKNHLGFVTSVLSFYEVERKFRVKIGGEPMKDLYTPTMAEVNKVVACSDEVLRRAIALACFGLRRGEICALTAADVDRKNCTVRISKALAKSKDGVFVLKDPKTRKSARTVQVTASVIDLLPTDGLLVPVSPDIISNRFVDAVKRAGVHRFRFHDLRSFFASIALSSAVGAGRRSVQDIGGWQTDRVLGSHYDRAIADQTARDRASIALYFANNLAL